MSADATSALSAVAVLNRKGGFICGVNPDMIRLAQELDALIYPVQYDTAQDMNVNNYPVGRPVDIWGQILGGIFGGGRRSGGSGQPRGTARTDYEIGNEYLRELASSTGGREYHADSLQNMSSAFANVAEELRRQYSIGYYPKRPPQPGQRRQINGRAGHLRVGHMIEKMPDQIDSALALARSSDILFRYGGDEFATPELDRFARRAVRFRGRDRDCRSA